MHLHGMNSSLDPRALRRIIILATAVIAVLIAASIGVYGLLTGPRAVHAPAPTFPAPTAPSLPTPSSLQGANRQPPGVQASSDPEAFARSAAYALFAWDTGSGFMPLDYAAAILDAGDPSGYEQAGLASDLATYLPTREAWIGLRAYATAQRLSIDAIGVPDAWAGATAQAHPGQLPPSATAYTIDGVRHRDGTWNAHPTSSERPVAFTVFIACPPPGKPCYLLRISQLDNPLR